MSDFQVLVFSLTGYKLLTLLTGLIFGSLGYKLFRVGVFEKAGELKTTWGDRSLVLKQAAPGTFFALFGVVIVATTLIKGVNFESLKGELPASQESVGRPFVRNELTREELRIFEKVAASKVLSGDERQTLLDYIVRQKNFRESLSGNAYTVPAYGFDLPTVKPSPSP